jgi:hypothetical protein
MGSPDMLDTLAEGDTLESSGRLDEVKSALGEDFAVGMFLEIDTVRELIETSEPPDQGYTDNIRPFLEPLNLFVYGANEEDDTARDRWVVNVDE